MTRRRPRICFHQSGQTIPGGAVLCTDQCTRIFPTFDLWAAAIREAAETVIAANTPETPS